MLKYFFLSGHVQYARYLTQYLNEMEDLPVKHKDGHRNAVSGDQFSEQTAITIGKGGLNGMTLSPELTSEWIDAFPFTMLVTKLLDDIYDEQPKSQSNGAKHKEEMPSRRNLDAADWQLILEQLEKHPHPLEDTRQYLFNPITGKKAPPDVNVMNSM